MGWASFLEDIEKRLDDAVVRLYSPPAVKRGSVSIESLQDTNQLLRMKNEELMKLVYTLKADISSKKQTDFCKDECARLKRDNLKLFRLLKNIKNEDAPLDPFFRKEAPAVAIRKTGTLKKASVLKKAAPLKKAVKPQPSKPAHARPKRSMPSKVAPLPPPTQADIDREELRKRLIKRQKEDGPRPSPVVERRQLPSRKP
jgi:hypothetical protein